MQIFRRKGRVFLRRRRVQFLRHACAQSVAHPVENGQRTDFQAIFRRRFPRRHDGVQLVGRIQSVFHQSHRAVVGWHRLVLLFCCKKYVVQVQYTPKARRAQIGRRIKRSFAVFSARVLICAMAEGGRRACLWAGKLPVPGVPARGADRVYLAAAVRPGAAVSVFAAGCPSLGRTSKAGFHA